MFDQSVETLGQCFIVLMLVVVAEELLRKRRVFTQVVLLDDFLFPGP